VIGILISNKRNIIRLSNPIIYYNSASNKNIYHKLRPFM
jgi:hypothetical protein